MNPIRLKALRQSRDITQVELARVSGISVSAISSYEGRQSKLPQETLEMLQQVIAQFDTLNVRQLLSEHWGPQG